MAVLVSAAWVSSAGAAPPVQNPDAQWLRRLDVLFGTDGAVDERLPAVGGPRERADRYRAFLRSRAEQPAFYGSLVSKLLATANVDLSAMPFGLEHRRIDGRDVYFLPVDGPCAIADTVDVHPWWDLSSTVSVCKRSYRPEIKYDDAGGSRQYCEATFVTHLNPRTTCRCGEMLLNCARDAQQREALTDAMRDEVVRTIQYVVQGHRPFADALTMQSSVRGDLGDFIYARYRYFKTGTFEYPRPDPAKPPTLRPRDPEFTGGILTSPMFLFFDPSRRLFVSMVWNDLLCIPHISTAVHASDMFNLGDARLRTREHIALAEMNGCRDCHARIENAVRAFLGFSVSSNGLRPSSQGPFAGTMQFYVADWRDLRGSGPATPEWVGRTIGSQPELTGCMVRKVEELIYGGYPVPELLDRHLRRRFATGQDLLALIEDAVVGRYVGVAELAP
jgi:hypothetical protein